MTTIGARNLLVVDVDLVRVALRLNESDAGIAQNQLQLFREQVGIKLPLRVLLVIEGQDESII